jgi:small-conductance mechanosensitive channel
MASFKEFLGGAYWGNSGQDYLVALGIFVALFVVFKIFDVFVVALIKRAAKKTKFDWDDVAVDFVSAIHWQFYSFVALYVAVVFRLVLSETVRKIFDVLLILFIAYYVAQGFSRVVDYFTNKQLARRRKEDSAQNTSMIRVFGTLFKAAIYVLILLMVLSNFGIEITPLIASLGVGGIAIAIALQSVLSDLFAAFAIYFDKPFKEGDFIIVGSDMGVVKDIGIKTTRIQALGGQELVLSNSDLTNSRINNYKKMEKRRVVFALGVEYSTPSKKLKKINEIVKKAVESTKHAKLDRTHFQKFGDFSLNFEVVYYVDSADYNLYMGVQQEINFKIREAFEKEGIVFAFPTQTLHLEGLGSRDK